MRKGYYAHGTAKLRARLFWGSYIHIGDVSSMLQLWCHTVMDHIKKSIPEMTEDTYLYPYLEQLKDFIHSGEIILVVEEKIGKLL